ncbi:tRNA threonylcarbamoyladenosine biosynthesis protein TsaE [Anaerosphaera aminiphila DSM 21120]|uniref:tRNA threonylcarbamoyladenosine biosynthesis protein TsaE n=1 Tax=Anaerosphaera aminiphila DSM 21120 TaxID=1120995 RepID=A0A1M5TTH5_9FIRM|nr:tRNA (adenosine(37)-N6)-threonylcarbamoyltransferase complex ATPase subunit type 1 TsaE [Anaerosphaera aminiphila]SHH53703.1 tRNA threonylcarbamoyladenosine biosynthesis protein TsaE [Anaerosphaera aminiphila DSM 21120]
MKIHLKDVEETENFGLALGKLLKPGDVICLNGDLGAGKTTLTKSIGKGMGIEDYITSPTFAIINEYYGDINLYHFDTYRLETDEDVFYLGFDEYFYGNGVCIIEWADKIKNALPEDYLELNITRRGELEREIEVVAVGERSEKLLEELK